LISDAGPFWAYVLENSEGRFYVGSTDDLERRVARHNSPGDARKFTVKNGPWRLVWSEPHPSRSDAMAREKQIKSMKSARWIREHLLSGRVPACRD
jgi:predicted GIY-YIG superfamily endonuclease